MANERKLKQTHIQELPSQDVSRVRIRSIIISKFSKWLVKSCRSNFICYSRVKGTKTISQWHFILRHPWNLAKLTSQWPVEVAAWQCTNQFSMAIAGLCIGDNQGARFALNLRLIQLQLVVMAQEVSKNIPLNGWNITHVTEITKQIGLWPPVAPSVKFKRPRIQ